MQKMSDGNAVKSDSTEALIESLHAKRKKRSSLAAAAKMEFILLKSIFIFSPTKCEQASFFQKKRRKR